MTPLHQSPAVDVSTVSQAHSGFAMPSLSGDSPLDQWGKRLLDVVIASLMLVLLALPMLALALLIRRDGGKAIFAHRRIGQYGREFSCLKFRTMAPDAEAMLKAYLEQNPDARAEWEKDYKLRHDPRITPIGHFLRRTSLDELPQLFNVLSGQMSLVGVRPVVREELPRYGDSLPYYLAFRPGLTGWWQVNGRNDVTYDERVEMDVWYVQNRTLWLDIRIIIKTALVVLKRDGAY
jgi:undecaprenyl-phosphate galactose phosphotransferase